MSHHKEYLLKVDDLSIVYTGEDDKVKAVDQLSLGLKEGESLGIIGESGSGKSSLALAIMGLIKDGEVQGKITYQEEDILAASAKRLKEIRWQKIALVFQNSLEVLNPVLTIGEQIKEPLRRNAQYSAQELEERVIELLELVGLNPDWRDSYPHNLSGGMRQRVLLAMALSCEPELLIIDEPTTGLDPVTKDEILQLLKKLQQRMDFSMIMISHDIGSIKELTSRVMTMYCGQVVEVGLTDKVLRDPFHPYTRGLLNSSPNLFKYKDLWGIEGEAKPGEGCAFSSRCCQSGANCFGARPPLEYVAVERRVACHKGGIEEFLEARNIKKTYQLKDKEITAVKEVSLKIKSGEVVALVGKSGSGKSTLAHSIAGVLDVDEGEVYYRGEQVTDNWATKMIGGMQIIFQDPSSSTSSRMKLLDVVKEPLEIIKWEDREQRKAKAIDCLKKVQLPTTEAFLNRYCHALSGGQRQRVAIARALVTEPKLLIADEITSMLDPSTQANLLRKLKGLQNQEGFSMLYITHDLHLARKIADKVCVMNEGEIVERGVSFEILENPKHIYTQKLLTKAFKGLI
ncbi:ABC transporter ATP-binding protein [Fuchsiella alkaliacetigena]|uniref:ABC transporter ATP-binding protein n=1 Tax=Fuchsiella alkaliacetigena TaxID=957042 RepID=UPI00200AF21D|nr:ABC transporter ATP-binding protein [Fuchsiella alkaliacetigena]MCK8823641.1 ABC transporter ATP-binding protein [Fuchsiella alkaliacetigena]